MMILLTLCAAVLLLAPFELGHLMTTARLLGGVRPPSSDLRVLLTPLTVPVGCLFAVAAGLLMLWRSFTARVTIVAVVAALTPLVFLATARSTLREMYPWETLGPYIHARPAPVSLLGRRAPSLTFYAGRPVYTASDDAALEAEIQHQCEGWLAVTADDWARLSAEGAIHSKASQVVAEQGRMVLVWFEDPSAQHAH
jgi:hypothetical protein